MYKNIIAKNSCVGFCIMNPKNGMPLDVDGNETLENPRIFETKAHAKVCRSDFIEEASMILQENLKPKKENILETNLKYFRSLKIGKRNMKTYTDNDIFPNNCWFADWQPSKPKSKEGSILIRQRDFASTINLIEIRVSPRGKFGLPKKQAEQLAKVIVKTMTKITT